MECDKQHREDNSTSESILCLKVHSWHCVVRTDTFWDSWHFMDEPVDSAREWIMETLNPGQDCLPIAEPIKKPAKWWHCTYMRRQKRWTHSIEDISFKQPRAAGSFISCTPIRRQGTIRYTVNMAIRLRCFEDSNTTHSWSRIFANVRVIIQCWERSKVCNGTFHIV